MSEVSFIEFSIFFSPVLSRSMNPTQLAKKNCFVHHVHRVENIYVAVERMSALYGDVRNHSYHQLTVPTHIYFGLIL